MLSVAQKKAIYQAIPNSFTINGTPTNVSHIYSTDKIGSYPVIVLNYLDEELEEQKAVGSVIRTGGEKGQRSYAMLSVNILAKKIDGLGINYVQISKEIARLLSIEMRTNWTDLSSARFMRKSSTRDLTHIEQSAGTLDVSRQQFDAFIRYDLDFT